MPLIGQIFKVSWPIQPTVSKKKHDARGETRLDMESRLMAQKRLVQVRRGIWPRACLTRSLILEKLRNGNLEAARNGDNLVIHEVTGFIFKMGNGAAIHRDAPAASFPARSSWDTGGCRFSGAFLILLPITFRDASLLVFFIRA